MQRERCLRRCSLSEYLRQYFIKDLVQFTTSLLDRNNKEILAADANEYAIDIKLLAELKRIGMIDSFIKKFNLPGLTSHATGSKPIDKV